MTLILSGLSWMKNVLEQQCDEWLQGEKQKEGWPSVSPDLGDILLLNDFEFKNTHQMLFCNIH